MLGSHELWLAPARAAGDAAPFPQALVEHAKRAAARPMHMLRQELPPQLANLDYDGYRQIRFNGEAANRQLHADLPCRIQYFHPGYLYSQPVTIATISHIGQATPAQISKPWQVDPGDFHYDQREVGQAVAQFVKQPDSQLKPAGWKLLYQMHKAGKWDEVVSFIGASYFRALGRGHHYGASFRGLVDGHPGHASERFPAFTHHWLVQTPSDTGSDGIVSLISSSKMVSFAMLEARDVVGLYRFDVTPSDITTIDVHMHLWPRPGSENKPLPELGIAPLTSMFLFGERHPGRFGDYRPEVHDSDALLIQTGEERLYRPLHNPTSNQTTQMQVPHLKGFGLLQRDRDFDNYQDLEAEYEKRPTLWVRPIGDWGPGAIELTELASNSEGIDNIIALWRPGTPIELGAKGRSWRYQLTVRNHAPVDPQLGRIVATRQTHPDGDRSRFVIEFDLPQRPDGEPVPVADVSYGQAMLQHLKLVPNEPGGTWRLAFELHKPKNSVVELRACLRQQGKAATETWSLLWRP